MSAREYKLRCPKAHAMWVPADSPLRWGPPACGHVKDGEACGLVMVDTGVYR